jgi:hypothetical protein
MNQEQKDGSGALFKNDRKEGEQDRDYQGSIKVGNREYWLSAWINTSKAGKKYMALSAKPKEAQTQQRSSSQPQSRDFDDNGPPF